MSRPSQLAKHIKYGWIGLFFDSFSWSFQQRREVLQRRLEAEKAYDDAEKHDQPEDLFAYYLRRLEIPTSFLFEIALGLGTTRDQFSLDIGPFHTYIEICVARADAHAPAVLDERWRRLWESLKAGMISAPTRSGDGKVAAQLAGVMFVCSVVLRRAYERVLPSTPTGVERGFEIAAKSVPIPVDTTQFFTQQLEDVSANLRWLHRQMRQSTPVEVYAVPRWL